MISLLSYHHADPSINNAGAAGAVHNLFGKLGAHAAGLLIGLFGLGAFWMPILLLLASVCFFSNQSVKSLYSIAGGGLLLMVTTGSLLAFKQDQYLLFGSKITAGGIIGIPLKMFMVRYANGTGGGDHSGVVLVNRFHFGHRIFSGDVFSAFRQLVFKVRGARAELDDQASRTPSESKKASPAEESQSRQGGGGYSDQSSRGSFETKRKTGAQAADVRFYA